VRIERIEFEAIGPFADAYDIDLTQLGDSSLFLIDGPTGAGKSTILDAITFGIYGDTSGSDTDKSRMRSQYAKANQESWVRITFSTAHGTYRIRRAPAYERPKANGKGFTESKATAQFQRLDGSDKWVTDFEQVADSGAAAIEAVGLSKAQFSQTVLLPQGEFDKFLKDDSKDRQIVLTKIFGTERFTKFKKLLKLRAAKVESDLNELNSKILQQATPMKSILELSLEDYVIFESLAIDIGSTDSALAFIEERQKGLVERLTQANSNLEKSSAAYNQSLAEFQQRTLEFSRKPRQTKPSVVWSYHSFLARLAGSGCLAAECSSVSLQRTST
jgi:DNA repair exonuclease SbcCD ATPase subunit